MVAKTPIVLQETGMLRLFYILYREKKLKFSSIMNFFNVEVGQMNAAPMHRKLTSLVRLGLFKTTEKKDLVFYEVDWNGVVGHLFHRHFNRKTEPTYDKKLIDYIRKHFLAYIHFGHKQTGTLEDAFIDVKETLHALKNFERIVNLNKEK